MAGPLAGLVVLEAGEGISAAYCCQILGVLGAEVVKVESPCGDQTRRLGPFPGDVPDRERSGLFLSLNRNKRSVALDLDCATGQDLFRRLAAHAAVVVENFPPGYLAARGLDYAALCDGHESLVMTSITPFGQDGPYRDWKGSEITLFALGGLMTLIGDIRREPLKFGGSPILHAAGLYAFAATLTALYGADATGLGQHVDVSMLESVAASHFQDLTDYEYRGVVRRRDQLRTPIPCADGSISFSVQAHHWPDFRRLILGDRAGDADADDAVERDRQRLEGELDTDILLWALPKTKYEAYRLGQEAHVPTAYIADTRDLVESPQYQARDYFVTVNHPRAGPLRYPGFPARLTGAELQHGPAPLLGQHTDEVLTRLAGLTEPEIVELKAAGVV